MSRPCPDGDEILRFLDGEVSENRAAWIRQHAGGCGTCRAEVDEGRRLIDDVRAPLALGSQAPAGEQVRRLLARLDEPRPVLRPRRPGMPVWMGVIGVAAAAAVAVLVVRPSVRPEDAGTFRPRGGHEASLAREVGVEVRVAGSPPSPLAAGARVSAETPYVVAYRNLGGTLYLLMFAVDAAGETHWLHPAFLDANEDPAAVELAPRRGDTFLEETVVLDRPAAGPLRIVTLLARTRSRVSSIEGLPPAQLTLETLRARFPEADVTELPLVVERR